MDKPPHTPPARRWFHRWALMEYTTGKQPRLISWHITNYGATSWSVQLMLDRDAGLGPIIHPYEHDRVWWGAVRASVATSWASAWAPQC